MRFRSSKGVSADAGIFTLPDELVALIMDNLTNRDIKNVRLSNKRLKANCVLRFDRAFVSPNPLDIEVLRSIAAHPQFSRQVKEIVWDDASFEPYDVEPDDCHDQYDLKNWVNDQFYDGDNSDSENTPLDRDREWGLAGWQEAVYTNPRFHEQGLQTITNRMTRASCVRLYQDIYQNQQNIISSDQDLEALREVLADFPALQRITITTQTYHPNVDCTTYKTPMIRSFPQTFVFPEPRTAWRPTYEDEEYIEESWEEIRQEYRGLIVMLQEAVGYAANIRNFVLDASTGIPHQFFAQPSQDLGNFQIICGPQLRRLDIAIQTGVLEELPRPGLGPAGSLKKTLRQTLSRATSLQEFSLRTMAYFYFPQGFSHTDLLEILPIQSWTELRRLALADLKVDPDRFIQFLKELPAAIEHLELDGVFADSKADVRGIIQDMKDRLRWVGNKPTVVLAFREIKSNYSNKIYCQDAIAEFFDGRRENPVLRDAEMFDYFERGAGVAMQVDCCEPDEHKPF